MEIVWEEPPQSNWNSIARRELQEFADALRANPGRWARYPRDAHPTVTTYIKKARSKVWAPAGSFEATISTVNGEKIVFVRYVGESKGDQ